jgi:hypothetical protein
MDATTLSNIQKRMRYPNLPIPSGELPEGKGMFLYVIDRIGTAVEVAEKAKAAGFDWVAIKVQNGRLLTDGGKDERYFLQLPIKQMFQELQKRGIQAIGWGYVYLNSDEQVLYEAATTLDAIRLYEPDGWIINAEGEARGQHTRVQRYLEGLRHWLKNDYVLGYSGYRFPKTYQPDYPIKQFATFCNYAVPQVYWVGAHNPGEQLDRCLAEYFELDALYGTRTTIIPAGAAYPSGNWKPSVTELRLFYTAVKSHRLPGWTYWEWYYAKNEPTWWAEIASQIADEENPSGDYKALLLEWFAFLGMESTRIEDATEQVLQMAEDLRAYTAEIEAKRKQIEDQLKHG